MPGFCVYPEGSGRPVKGSRGYIVKSEGKLRKDSEAPKGGGRLLLWEVSSRHSKGATTVTKPAMEVILSMQAMCSRSTNFCVPSVWQYSLVFWSVSGTTLKSLEDGHLRNLRSPYNFVQ